MRTLESDASLRRIIEHRLDEPYQGSCWSTYGRSACRDFSLHCRSEELKERGVGKKEDIVAFVIKHRLLSLRSPFSDENERLLLGYAAPDQLV